jgi:DNA-binding beta-propeller fold protein YncE
MAVDETHQHVFVSAGGQSTDIKVLDFDGHVVQTLTGEPGASGMAIEGGVLYVALRNAHQVDRIDTSTLNSLGPLSLGKGTAPYALAWAGGRLWVVTGPCLGLFQERVVSLDPRTGSEQSYPDRFFPNTCPSLAVSPADSNLLVAWDTFAPWTVSVYRVVNGHAVLLVRRLMSESFFPRAAVSIDGSELLMPGGPGVQAFSLQTLKPLPTAYNAGPLVNGVAAAPSGHIIAIAGTDNTDLWDFRGGVPTPEESLDVGSFQGQGRWIPNSRIYPGAVAVTSGNLVFVVTGDEGNGQGHDAWFNVWHPYAQN